MSQSNSKNQIEHLGRVVEVEPDKIKVSIVSQSSCSSCSSKSNCVVSGTEDKIVDIGIEPGAQIKVNDLVTVVLNYGSGAKAVILGYFIPFLVLMITVILMLSFGFSEGIAGLTAIGMLIPYYLVLYFTRKKQTQIFDFKLKSY